MLTRWAPWLGVKQKRGYFTADLGLVCGFAAEIVQQTLDKDERMRFSFRESTKVRLYFFFAKNF